MKPTPTYNVCRGSEYPNSLCASVALCLYEGRKVSLLLLNRVRSHSKPQTRCVKSTFVPVFSSLSTTRGSGGTTPSLTLAFDEGEWSASQSYRFAPDAHFMGVWVSVGLDAVEKSVVRVVSRTPDPRSSNPWRNRSADTMFLFIVFGVDVRSDCNSDTCSLLHLLPFALRLTFKYIVS